MDNPQKSLESSRLRIQQLVQTLDSFRISLVRKPPNELPPWEQLQSHFNVLSSALDSLTSTLHTHFPAHSTSALTSYPLPNFPAQTHEILLTTLLTKKPPPETFDSVWAALQAPPVDAATEELWGKAAEIVEKIQMSREWYDEVVTAEERDTGAVREEEWVLGGEEGEGAEERRRRAEREMNALTGVLRFCATGVPIEKQTPLPKKR
ncbi:hypothetical protein K440DRAFT_592789 [Wilcoxina mikolae CBS 423.85]|nr:hypothetical protein K440DRAFT_592789 [Wilcoxina mikolae CBS 423.85]